MNGASTVRPQRIALASWEIGRAASGLGVKIGGLGAVVEELPRELVAAALARGEDIEVTVLSPCFAHYDRTQLRLLPGQHTALIDGHRIEFEAFEHVFEDEITVVHAKTGARSTRCASIRHVYFWDDWQLNWTGPRSVYPTDAWFALRLYAALSQAMASLLRAESFDTLHLHDYHVGLVSFYLEADVLARMPVHLTIHNATYQGTCPLVGTGFETLDRLGLDGPALFHRYFDFFDRINPLKACMLKVHEGRGRVTTVSGNLEGTTGYAAEVREEHAHLRARATALKGTPPFEVFLPNMHLDLFERIPIAGITNGLGERNRPDRMPELSAAHLASLQARRPSGTTLFRNPLVQREMLAHDHHFDVERLAIKQRLRDLLLLECFGELPRGEPVVLSAVGRLVQQKNLGLVAAIIERTLARDAGARFVIVASPQEGDDAGKAEEAEFFRLAALYPRQVFFDNTFNAPLCKLVQCGSDFTLVPSRFEPCGLVDWEGALAGSVPIARATGGLTKIAHCGYLYEWLDVADFDGEARAFDARIDRALEVFRWDRPRHDALMRAGMRTDTSWRRAANDYLDLYRYGHLAKRWGSAREALLADFARVLGNERPLFARFFTPGHREYADGFDWLLRQQL